MAIKKPNTEMVYILSKKKCILFCYITLCKKICVQQYILYTHTAVTKFQTLTNNSYTNAFPYLCAVDLNGKILGDNIV